MATNETNKLIFGTTTYNLKDDSGTASSHTHTKSQITDFPSSMTPSSHTHGNIQNGGTLQTNDITIANGDKLVVTDSSDSSKVARTSVSFDGSTTTKCLTQKGTWETFGTSNLTIGTTGTTACAGNDSRLSDARTPSNDSNLVHKTGNESIDGNKTFNDDIIINNSDDDNLKSIKFITSESSIPQIQACRNSLNFENADDYNFDAEVYINNNTHINGELYVDNLGSNGNYVGLLGDIDLNNQGIVGPVYYFNFSQYNSYEVGDYCYYNGVVYKCTTAHTGAWNNSHFKAVSNSILLGGDICLNNDLIITSDGLNSDSTISITSDTDIEFNAKGGSVIVNGGLEVDGITTTDSISIDAPGADILIPTSATDGNIAIAPAFSTSKAYAVGDYVIYNNEVYKCTTAHSASAWNYSHFSDITNKIVSVDDIIGKTFEATGSDYAEKFETLEDCPICRFVTLDGEKIKLAQPEDDYILGITSELPSIIGDKENQGTPVGLLGKLWVECDDTVKVNSFVTSGKDGIATKSDKGYRVMTVDGNKCKVLVK